MDSPRRRVLGGVLAMVMVATVGADAAESRADPPPAVVYAYDELGRLVAVTVAAEGSAVYHYDQVGNLVEVSRQPAGALSVFAVVPARAEAGDVVRVHGTGFSTRPGRNRVSVGGASAEVIESTKYVLTVGLPDEASSGPVTVSVGRTAAAGELHMQVDQPPKVTSFSPEVVMPGDRLSVTGTRFSGDAMVDMVVLADTLYGRVESASSTELVATVPPGVTTGTVSVATPDGTAYAPGELLAVPWTDYPALAPAEPPSVAVGESVSMELDGTGTALVTSFTGTAGDVVSAEVAGDLTCPSLHVGLAGPRGPVRNPDARGFDRWCGGAVRLPDDGTYTVLLAPRDRQSGSVTLTLVDASQPGPSVSPPAFSPSPSEPPAPTATPWPTSGGQTPPPALAVIPQQVSAGQEPLLAGAAIAPVDLASGLLVHMHTDLLIDDLVPLPVTRSYQPVSGRVGSDDVREFGIGPGMEYALTLRFSSAQQFADLSMPDGSTIPFERVTEGTGVANAVFEAPTTGGVFDGARITLDGSLWRLQLDNGTALMFDYFRRAALVAVRDARGNALTIGRERDSRNRPGNVTSVYSPTGRGITFTYDDQDRVVTARNHVGHTVHYHYHDDGMLATVVPSTGGRIGYEYDDERRIVEITGAEGASLLRIAYDDDGRVISQRLPDDAEFTYSYATTETTIEIAQLDGEPETTTQEVIAEAEMTDPAGLTRRVSFDSGHWVADTVEAGGEEQTVRAERDPDTGFVTAIEEPDGFRTSYEYDSAGRPVRLVETDGDGQERSYHMAYDPDTHELVSFTDPDGTVHTYTRDEAGNLVGEETAGGSAVGYTYDDHGRLTSITDQGEHTTRIDYELAHRVTVTDPHGHMYREFLDAAGRLVAVTDAAGATTRIDYDEQGLPVSLTDPVGGQIQFRYDAHGNPAALTDAAGNTTTYEVDDRGLVTTRTDASGASERFTYDDAGRMVSHVDRRGIRTDLRHDAFDRLVELAYGVDDNDEAASTVRLRYDAANRLVEVVDSAYGTIGFDYDQHSRLIRESTPDGDITYAYDSVGRRVAMTLPDGTETRYSYDAAGFLTSVDRGDAEVRATRDPRGALRRLELPGGLTADYQVDERGLVRGIDYQHTAGDFAADLQYGYDAAGRQVSVAGSLAGAELPPAAGPREYGPANRLVRDGETRYVYDEAGNLLDDGVHTYTWDERGQLIAVDGLVSATFAYDPFGRRTSKTVDGVTTTYTYDGQNVVAQGGDGPAVTYLTGLGLDEVFARVDAGGVHSYLTDARGSVVAVADQEGTLTTRYRYDPYGVTTASGAPEPGGIGFTGRERDETGLHYHRHRYYQPELGRFISEDPLGFHAGDPNLYAYTFGDPVNHVDPDGRQAVGVGVGVCIAALGVAFGVAMDAWDDMMEIMDPDRGPRFGTEEAQIALDRINRRLQMTMDAWVTICSVSMGFSLPGFGGLATRGVGSFGRGLPTLGRGPGLATRPPGAPATAAQAGAGPRPTPRAGCSFDADTLVLLADGAWVPISQIEVGDRVLAADPVTGEQDAREVTHTWVHDDTLVDLVVDDDAGDGPADAAAGVTAVTTTADHPFWSETSDAWLPAEELAPGELLLTADGDTVAVVGLDHDSIRVGAAYDLTVDGLHSYYVVAGNTSVLVHNTCGPGRVPGGVNNLRDGAHMSTNDALDTAVDFLGPGYRALGGGRFLSRDGLRQVRMTDADLAHPRQNPHINFETYNQPIGPGVRSGGPASNIHIYLPGEPGWHLP